MAIEHECARNQHVKENARRETIVQAQPNEMFDEKERRRVTIAQQEAERLRTMGRSGIQQERVRTAFAHQQANAILRERAGGRCITAVVGLGNQ